MKSKSKFKKLSISKKCKNAKKANKIFNRLNKFYKIMKKWSNLAYLDLNKFFIKNNGENKNFRNLRVLSK